MANKAYSLSHAKWMCKYRIVFTPKYRRKAIYGQIRSDAYYADFATPFHVPLLHRSAVG